MAKNVATKEHRRFARGLIEGLESRVHAGPPIAATEIASAHEFLRQCSFSPASDYYSRLSQLQTRVAKRTDSPPRANGTRNYGGEAGSRWIQVQSIYDHVILSTCYAGEFNLKRGRVKLSHRFNNEGRIDFVELKFLNAMSPELTGEIRKLVLVKNYRDIQKDWHEATGFTLRVLPQELVFLFGDIFRCAKDDMLAWLINIGHWMAIDLTNELRTRERCRVEDETPAMQNQLPLAKLRNDEVALPILEKAGGLESAVESSDDAAIVVRYHRI